MWESSQEVKLFAMEFRLFDFRLSESPFYLKEPRASFERSGTPLRIIDVSLYRAFEFFLLKAPFKLRNAFSTNSETA